MKKMVGLFVFILIVTSSTANADFWGDLKELVIPTAYAPSNYSPEAVYWDFTSIGVGLSGSNMYQDANRILDYPGIDGQGVALGGGILALDFGDCIDEAFSIAVSEIGAGYGGVSEEYQIIAATNNLASMYDLGTLKGSAIIGLHKQNDGKYPRIRYVGIIDKSSNESDQGGISPGADIDAVAITGIGSCTSQDSIYGALAFVRRVDSSWRYNISWNHDTASSAQSSALQGCGSDGDDCNIIYTLQSETNLACGALYISSNSSPHSATAPTIDTAKQVASTACKSYNSGVACTLVVSHCARR